MKLIDKIVMIVLAFVCLFIAINHIWLGLFGDTAFKFAIMLPIWAIFYGLIVTTVRREI